MEGKSLRQDQVGAIRLAIKMGEILQGKNPEIAELYRIGYTMEEISRDLSIGVTYGVSERVAATAVYNAINGYEGGFGLNSYEGLIPDSEERESLRLEKRRETASKVGIEMLLSGRGIHGQSEEERREAAKKGGRQSYEQKAGLHSLSEKEKSEVGRRGGLKGGRRISELGIGIHSLSKEEKQEAGRQSAASRGYTPWDKDEIEYAYELSQQEEFQQGSRVRNGLVAEKLNERYHGRAEVRNAKTVGIMLCKHRKSLEDKLGE